MEENKVLECVCHSSNHISLIQYDEELNQCYLSVHLRKLPWYLRLKHAIRYVFGYKSVYGDFDEFIWDINTVRTLLPILKTVEANHIKEECNKEIKNNV